MLVERESELSAIEASVRSAIGGHGGAVVVEGQAGIGKSSLLDQARRRASAAGMTVLMAQGAALEQDFGFGIVRQLFEPVIRDAGRTRASGQFEEVSYDSVESGDFES